MGAIEENLIQTLAESEDYDAYEAIPNSGNKIKVPNFHYIVYKRSDDVWVGYCIDFDLLAYSKDSDKEKAEQKIFSRLCQMVISYISTLIETDDLESLYDNCNWGFLENTWGVLFAKKFNHRKVLLLNDSLKKYIVEISSETEDITDNEKIDIIYKDLAKKGKEIDELKAKLKTLLAEKGANLVGFMPRARKIA